MSGAVPPFLDASLKCFDYLSTGTNGTATKAEVPRQTCVLKIWHAGPERNLVLLNPRHTFLVICSCYCG